MIEELQAYGLSEREANVYLVCLKAGKATANRIAEMAGLARSTTYDVLDRLKSLGLLSTAIVDSKTQFIANDPSSLLTTLEDRKASIKKILPSLKAAYNQVGDRPHAEVFQGKIAIVKLLEEMLETAKSIKVIGSQGNALEKVGYHPEKFRMKRLARKIKIRQLLEVSEESRKVTTDKYTEVRFLKALNSSKEAIFLLDDCVYHIVFQYEISAIRIRSKDHAAAMEIMFDELWKTASVKC
ncbi:MAG: helix-turn-helix domain-containing protein [Candidatus Micrarchaeia archaeon]|jgi:sugar-specific transcriptional regulator TrmB